MDKDDSIRIVVGWKSTLQKILERTTDDKERSALEHGILLHGDEIQRLKSLANPTSW